MNRRLITALFMAGLSLTAEAGEVLLPADTLRVYDLDELVVTARPKESFRLRQQPVSSSSFNAADLLATGATDLRELSAHVPSFVMPQYGSRLTSSIYIRGIGSRITSPAMGIYVDNIPILNAGAFNFHTYGLSRVDVLRGPQGTLYGQNTEGGLVHLHTLNPKYYQGTDVRIGVGTHFQRTVEAEHFQKLDERLALSVSAFYNGTNGFFRNQHTGHRADNMNEAGGRFRLVYDLTDRWNLDASADYQWVNQHGFPYGRLSYESDDNYSLQRPSTTTDNTYRRQMLTSAIHVEHKGKETEFHSMTSYQHLADRMFMDQDYQPGDYMHLLQKQRCHAVTEELSLKSRQPVGERWHWAAGVFASMKWNHTDGPVNFGPDMGSVMFGRMASTPGFSMQMGAPATFRLPQLNVGVYHESNIDLTDRLTATVGLRYDFTHSTIDYQSAAYMFLNIMGQTANVARVYDGSTSNDFHQLLPKFGLRYRLNSQGSNVYAIVAKGYRSGGYNLQMFGDVLSYELKTRGQGMFAGGQTYGNVRQQDGITYFDPTAEDFAALNKVISYEPETSWNYEAGTHLNLLEGRMHFDFSTYYMSIANQQLSQMAGNYGFGRQMVNAGKSHSCGLEATLGGKADGGRLSWTLCYGFSSAEFDEYTDSVKNEAGEKQAVDYSDRNIPFVPMHTFSARADYRFDIHQKTHDDAFCLRSITVGANVTGQGRVYWNEANTRAQKAYAILGAHVDADLGQLSLSIWGRNLTNTRYCTFAVGSAATGEQLWFGQQGNPAQAGIDLRLHL